MAADTRAAPTLVGRTTELGVLADALDRARAGFGGVVLVEGEAGIGKSRLLAELAVRAESFGVALRQGSGEELEQDRPFGVVVDALGPVSAGGLDGLGPDRRFLAQDQLVDVVEDLAASSPLLVTFDDLQWADQASLAAIWAMARRAGRTTALLVLAFRPFPHSNALDRVIDGCIEFGAPFVALDALDADAVASLATEFVGRTPGKALLEELDTTRGNPFFVLELLGAFADNGSLDGDDDRAEIRVRPMPPRVRAALLRRVGALGSDAESVLRVAAVLGSSFSLGDLALVLDRPVADVHPLVDQFIRSGLLAGDDGRLGFRHDLIRESLYEEIPVAVRSGLHREAGRVLDGRIDPAFVARHVTFGASRGDEAAIRTLRGSAEVVATSDPGAAAEILGHAAALCVAGPERAALHADQARALLDGGSAGEAATVAEAGLMVRDADPLVAAQLHLARAEAYAHQGSLSASSAAFSDAMDTGALDAEELAYALARQAEIRVWSFELGAAWDGAERALESVGSVRADVATGARNAMCAIRSFQARFTEAVELGRAAVAAAGDDPDALRRTPHAYLGFALLGADRHDEARSVVNDGFRRSSALGQVLVLPPYHACLVRLAWFSGDWDGALAEADTSASLAEDFGLGWGGPGNEAVCGLIALHRGDPVRAQTIVDRLKPLLTLGGDAAGSEMLVFLEAELLELAGNVEGAATRLLELFDLMAALEMSATRLWLGPECTRLAVAAGLEQHARRVAADVEAIATIAVTPTARGAALACRGIVTTDASALDAAADAFAEAGRPLDELRACRAGASTSSGAKAVALLRRALALAEQLDARFDARRVTSELRALGAPTGTKGPRTRAATGWDALTEAERQVAALIADGLRNAEIAERLFVSRRTVESHVSRLYVKLEAGTRVELANQARARRTDRM